MRENNDQPIRPWPWWVNNGCSYLLGLLDQSNESLKKSPESFNKSRQMCKIEISYEFFIEGYADLP